MREHLKIARFLTDLLDNKFKLGKFGFGLDPFFSLFPFLGGLIPAVLSFYIVWIGVGIKLPPDKISQMVTNIILDFLLGGIPVIGVAADFIFKSNLKNMEILESYLKADVQEGQVV